MDDLISRRAALDAFWQSEVKFRPSQIDEVMRILEQLPSAQPERKTGRWIKMSDVHGVYWACGECGEDIPRISHFDHLDPRFDPFPRLESIDKTKFCPSCGAEMKGDNDD